MSCLLSTIGVTAVLADGDAPAKKPKIVVTPMTVDFGTISDDVKSKAVFTIENKGDDELDIYDVKPTCGCTVANLSSKLIAPGKTATLEAVYDSHNATGPIHRFVNVASNDPATPTLGLGISAVVNPKPAPDVRLSVYNIPNINIAKGGHFPASVKLVSSGQLDLEIEEITSSPGVSLKFGDIDVPAGKTVKASLKMKPNEEKEMTIDVAPVAPSGNFQEIVTIRTNSKKKPGGAVTIIIQGVIQG